MVAATATCEAPAVTDVVDPGKRSKMMSNIRGRDTQPELLVRRHLHAAGFRYRLHDRRLPGRPDIVLPRYHAVVLVHGCFWHRHPGCRFAYTPKSRQEFWQAKFDDNVRRDEHVRVRLSEMGWRVFVVWECGLRRPEVRERGLEVLDAWLRSGWRTGSFP